MTERMYNLKDDAVEMVTYPENIRNQVNQAAGLWQEFSQLPDDVKNMFAASDLQWTIGYEAKNSEGNKGDRKENFDFSTQGAKDMLAIADDVNNETARQFIESIQELGRQMRPMIESFGQRIEDTYGVEGFGDIARRSSDSAFFRFLHYPSTGVANEDIATAHVDHSGFTFHLFETTDGCERLTFEGNWESLPVEEGQAAAFASMQTQLVSNGEIKAMAHRVRSNEESARLGRFAIVCFVALEGIPSYDRKTHGRLQEKVPGFNYTMPLDEFAGLFKRS